MFKAGQGYMNVITFENFDPANPKSVELKLADLKIFGRNLERKKVVRVLNHPTSVDLYIRTQDNVVSLIQYVTSSEDLKMDNIQELTPIPDLITDFEPFEVSHYKENEYCIVASKKGMLRLYKISKNTV